MWQSQYGYELLIIFVGDQACAVAIGPLQAGTNVAKRHAVMLLAVSSRNDLAAQWIAQGYDDAFLPAAPIHADRAAIGAVLNAMRDGIFQQRLQQQGQYLQIARQLIHPPVDLQAVTQPPVLHVEILSCQVELITEASAAPGERHEHLDDHLGEIAIWAWAGNPGDTEAELGGVDWIRAVEWVPYQLSTFVTPSFAGYVSGHSTFSRAAAEVLTSMTGSPYFPGGLGQWTVPAGSLEFELGPSVDVPLQWATYYDAADQAGLSRLYGGIHVEADDLRGRVMGAQCGQDAWTLAQAYWDGTARTS